MRRVMVWPLENHQLKQIESKLHHKGYDALAYTGGVTENGRLPFWTNAPNSVLKKMRVL